MNHTGDATALLAVLLTRGAGRATAHRARLVAAHLGMSLDDLIRLPRADRVKRVAPVHPGLAEALGRCTREARNAAARLVKAVSESGGHCVPAGAAEHPSRVVEALGTSAPPVLFLRGDLKLLDDPAAAIVGARLATAKGLHLAAKSAAALAGLGVPIVSGGAQGVDTAAHNAALGSEGTTVVVLPQGLLTYEAPDPIREAVEAGRALIVSGFSPDSPWQTHAAVTRNATIAALSDMVCVIEPGKQGGSIRTARCAVEQGARLLVHVSRAKRSVAEPLKNAGALPLVEPGGTFSAPYLARMWNDRPVRPRGQADLFA